VTEPPGRDPEQSLATRYGRPARSRYTGPAVVALLAVVLLAWAVWAALGQSHDAVGGLVQSFRVTSPHEVSVTVQITRTSTGPVRCRLSAVAEDHSQVGETVVRIPSGPSGTRSLTTTIKTERTATTAVVAGCR
jgi:hypothetical protein